MLDDSEQKTPCPTSENQQKTLRNWLGSLVSARECHVSYPMPCLALSSEACSSCFFASNVSLEGQTNLLPHQLQPSFCQAPTLCMTRVIHGSRHNAAGRMAHENDHATIHATCRRCSPTNLRKKRLLFSGSHEIGEPDGLGILIRTLKGLQTQGWSNLQPWMPAKRNYGHEQFRIWLFCLWSRPSCFTPVDWSVRDCPDLISHFSTWSCLLLRFTVAPWTLLVSVCHQSVKILKECCPCWQLEDCTTPVEWFLAHFTQYLSVAFFCWQAWARRWGDQTSTSLAADATRSQVWIIPRQHCSSWLAWRCRSHPTPLLVSCSHPGQGSHALLCGFTSLTPFLEDEGRPDDKPLSKDEAANRYHIHAPTCINSHRRLYHFFVGCCNRHNLLIDM